MGGGDRSKLGILHGGGTEVSCSGGFQSTPFYSSFPNQECKDTAFTGPCTPDPNPMTVLSIVLSPA